MNWGISGMFGFFNPPPAPGQVTRVRRLAAPPPPTFPEDIMRDVGPRPYHADPGRDGPYAPKGPVRERNPRAAPIEQPMFHVPAGCVGQCRWRSRASQQWTSWSTRAGPCDIRQPPAMDAGEYRIQQVVARPVGGAPPQPDVARQEPFPP
jgi:hypothetical protein